MSEFGAFMSCVVTYMRQCVETQMALSDFANFNASRTAEGIPDISVGAFSLSSSDSSLCSTDLGSDESLCSSS